MIVLCSKFLYYKEYSRAILNEQKAVLKFETEIFGFAAKFGFNLVSFCFDLTTPIVNVEKSVVRLSRNCAVPLNFRWALSRRVV